MKLTLAMACLALAIGSVEETVSVDAAAPLVDVQSAGISDVVDNERILELPLQVPVFTQQQQLTVEIDRDVVLDQDGLRGLAIACVLRHLREFELHDVRGPLSNCLVQCCSERL